MTKMTDEALKYLEGERFNYEVLDGGKETWENDNKELVVYNKEMNSLFVYSLLYSLASGNPIYVFEDGYEEWNEYDEGGNCIWYKTSEGEEWSAEDEE